MLPLRSLLLSFIVTTLPPFVSSIVSSIAYSYRRTLPSLCLMFCKAFPRLLLFHFIAAVSVNRLIYVHACAPRYSCHIQCRCPAVSLAYCLLLDGTCTSRTFLPLSPTPLAVTLSLISLSLFSFLTILPLSLQHLSLTTYHILHSLHSTHLPRDSNSPQPHSPLALYFSQNSLKLLPSYHTRSGNGSRSSLFNMVIVYLLPLTFNIDISYNYAHSTHCCTKRKNSREKCRSVPRIEILIVKIDDYLG